MSNSYLAIVYRIPCGIVYISHFNILSCVHLVELVMCYNIPPYIVMPFSTTCTWPLITGTLLRWRCRGILDWTLDSESTGSGFDSRPYPGTFVLQQGTLSTLLLSTQVYKWVPGRMRTLLLIELALCALFTKKWRLARMLPREQRKCTFSAELIDSYDRGNSRLWSALKFLSSLKCAI